jgi:hypothetical protein
VEDMTQPVSAASLTASALKYNSQSVPCGEVATTNRTMGRNCKLRCSAPIPKVPPAVKTTEYGEGDSL